MGKNREEMGSSGAMSGERRGFGGAGWYKLGCGEVGRLVGIKGLGRDELRNLGEWVGEISWRSDTLEGGGGSPNAMNGEDCGVGGGALA